MVKSISRKFSPQTLDDVAPKCGTQPDIREIWDDNLLDISGLLNEGRIWLGDRDSNPDQVGQSHPSYH